MLASYGYGQGGAVASYGYGGRGIIGAVMDLFLPRIKSLKQRYQIKWLT